MVNKPKNPVTAKNQHYSPRHYNWVQCEICGTDARLALDAMERAIEERDERNDGE